MIGEGSPSSVGKIVKSGNGCTWFAIGSSIQSYGVPYETTGNIGTQHTGIHVVCQSAVNFTVETICKSQILSGFRDAQINF